MLCFSGQFFSDDSFFYFQMVLFFQTILSCAVKLYVAMQNRFYITTTFIIGMYIVQSVHLFISKLESSLLNT